MANILSRKQENLITAREKIRASREGRIINPAVIAKTPLTAAAIDSNNNPNNTPDSPELENPREGKIKGFKLITEIIKDNKKASTPEAKAWRKNTQKGRDKWRLRRGALVHHGRL